MARLGVAAAGAGIGLFFGSPQLGWLLGSALGSFLFPDSGPDSVIEGPRLQDLTISSSAYGAFIPCGFGTMRLSGNMIWTTGIEEIKNVQSQEVGGKGGGGATQTNINYEYFASFAIAFGKGPASHLLRVWADGKIIYDQGNTTGDIRKKNLNVDVYLGEPFQDPNDLIVSDKGTANSPAYRDLVYMVFRRLPLKDFGNRVPNITAEWAFEGTKLYPITSSEINLNSPASVDQGFVNDYFAAFDFLRYQGGKINGWDPDTTPAWKTYTRIFDVRSMKEIRQVEWPDSFNGTLLNGRQTPFIGQVINCTRNGVYWGTAEVGEDEIYTLNPATLQMQDCFGVAGATSIANSPDGFGPDFQGFSNWMASQSQNYIFHCSYFWRVGVLRVDSMGNMEYVWDNDYGGGISDSRSSICNGTTHGARGQGFADGYFSGGPDQQFEQPGLGTHYIYKLRIHDNAGYDPLTGVITGVEQTEVAAIDVADFAPGYTGTGNQHGPFYDHADGNLIMEIEVDEYPYKNQSGVDVAFGCHIIKIDSTTGAILWVSETRGLYSTINYENAMGNSYVDGTWGGVRIWREHVWRLTDGYIWPQSIEESSGPWNPPFDSSLPSWWDSRTMSTYGNAGVIQPNVTHRYDHLRYNGLGIDLGILVTEICSFVGLDSTDIDVTNLTGTTVPGYVISRSTNARTVLEQLATVYLFDGVESDYLLKFEFRDGKSSQATFTNDDLAILDNETGEYYREDRVQEVELPVRYSITYLDKDQDYNQQTHSARRVLNPLSFRTVSSRNEVNLNAPIALNNSFVKQAAERSLISAWQERTSYRITIPWEYVALDPTDIVTLNLDSQITARTRLIQTDIGANLSLEVTALSESAAQYTSTVDSDGGAGPLTQEFAGEGPSRIILLNTPLLRDSDDVSRTVSRLYHGVGGYGQPGWTAGTVYQSADGTTFTEVDSVVSEMRWGSVLTVLPDTDTPDQTDEDLTLVIYLVTGSDSLASITQLEMLNGGNAAGVITPNGDVEVIQFRDVVDDGDGQYTVSGILRGRRGSDAFTADHVAGSPFIMLDTSGAVSRFNLTLGQLNTTQFFRAVAGGEYFEDTDVVQHSSPGNDLRPYSPVQLVLDSGTWGSDVDLAWQRRTRIGGTLVNSPDYLGEVPLNEDSEEYDLDILGPNGNVLRSATGLTTDSYTYTSANQTTDFPAATFVDLTAQFGSNWDFEDSPVGASLPFEWDWDTNGSGEPLQVRSTGIGNTSGPQAGDRYLYWGSFPSSSQMAIHRSIDVSKYISYTAAGGSVEVRTKFWLSETQSQGDEIRLVYEEFDSDDVSTGTTNGSTINPTGGTWVEYQEDITLAATTARLNIRIELVTEGGSWFEISLDSVSVEINEDNANKPSLDFRVRQNSAQVGAGFWSRQGTVDI